VPWHALYIETPELQRLSERQRQRILKSLKLAQEMGAETEILSGSDAVDTVVGYARDHNLSMVLVGRDHLRPRWPWHHSFADRIASAPPNST